jgi:hypothetical protein
MMNGQINPTRRYRTIAAAIHGTTNRASHP